MNNPLSASEAIAKAKRVLAVGAPVVYVAIRYVVCEPRIEGSRCTMSNVMQGQHRRCGWFGGSDDAVEGLRAFAGERDQDWKGHR
ncbi:hypothetical protein MLD63_13425 [Paracoccus sp. TK19116]|uniref:Uncharacterized protein n=1 Tax=Paracoccus albicereus TaxID=2922394 RepID=A0ABT1MVB9_9RHOB|nr:hypothetical protein [Paracoccus albicereus]MCQ0971421.1 hypothetical protein [Paracoccus albicereus]